MFIHYLSRVVMFLRSHASRRHNACAHELIWFLFLTCFPVLALARMHRSPGSMTHRLGARLPVTQHDHQSEREFSHSFARPALPGLQAAAYSFADVPSPFILDPRGHALTRTCATKRRALRPSRNIRTRQQLRAHRPSGPPTDARARVWDNNNSYPNPRPHCLQPNRTAPQPRAPLAAGDAPPHLILACFRFRAFAHVYVYCAIVYSSLLWLEAFTDSS